MAVEQLEVIPKTWREGGSLKTTWFQLGFHTVLGNLQLMASRSLNVNLFVFNKKDNSDDGIKDVQRRFNAQAQQYGYCILGVNGLMEGI